MRTPLLLALLVTLIAGCGGSRGAALTTMAGTWVGEGSQWNDGDRTREPDDTWNLSISLGADPTAGGSVDYPDLACGGSLAYVGPNTRMDAQPGDMIFQESLAYGTDNCADGGTVLLRPSGRTLIYAWSIDGYAAQSAARLERQ